jgi:hypothetical protein
MTEGGIAGRSESRSQTKHVMTEGGMPRGLKHIREQTLILGRRYLSDVIVI